MKPKRPAVWWLAPLSCAFIAAAVRFYFYANLDLTPLYGPGGVKSITALLENYPQRDWATWLMGSALPLFANDIETTARGVSFIGSVLSVLGLSLCAHALAGSKAAWTVGICTAFYSPLIWTGLLVGADAPGTGLVWLGLGILFGLAKSPKWWFIVPFGIFLTILGAKVKVTAMPALAFIAVPPVIALVNKKFWIGLIYGLLISLSLWYGLTFIPDSNAHVGTVATPTLNDIASGWNDLRQLFQKYDVLPQLAIASTICALLPGKNWLPRITILFISAFVSGYVATVVGDKLRPRYLIPSTLTLILLVGCAPHLWHWPKKLRLLPYALTTILATMLLFDSLAFHQSWSKLMHERDGAELAAFPSVPEGWKLRYDRPSGLLHSDHSAIGIRVQHDLSQNHPYSATLGVPLRDGREFHLRASTGLTGKEYRILEPKYCCKSADIQLCAERTILQLKASGGRLILPIVRQYHNRIPHQSSSFTNALIRVAKQESKWVDIEPWWGYLDAEGDGVSPVPCPRPKRDGKGRKRKTSP